MRSPGPQVLHARSRFRYRGADRPPWADPPAPGQESVWDYPRPPRVETVDRLLRVVHGEWTIAETRDGLRVVETAGAPTYYFPQSAVDDTRLRPSAGRSFCEWKGEAVHWQVGGSPDAAWSYPDPYPEFDAIRGWIAFHPARVDACWLDGVRAEPQPGGYYGGWVTPDLAGPIKGGPGSSAW